MVIFCAEPALVSTLPEIDPAPQAQAPRLDRRPRLSRAVVRIVLGAIALRLVTAVLALFVNLAFPLDQREQFTMWGRTDPFWDAFTRYDSGYYWGIARLGYSPAPGGRSNIAYFPVYPLLMRYVGRLFGRTPGDTYLGGIVVAWVSFVLAMAALYHLARLDLPPRRAERAVLLTAIFPFAFFFGVAYSESTFLLFSVLAFYLFRTRRWIAGGLCGAIAIATRTPAFVLWPALAWTAWRRAGPTGRERAVAAAGLVLATSGFVGYCLYIYNLTGNPFEWVATLERWGEGYHPGGPPWTAPVALMRRLLTHPYAYLGGERMAPYDTLYGVTGLLFVTAVPFVWARFGAAYGLYMLLTLYIPLSTGVFEGMGRYCSILFPAFIWLASIKSQTLGTAVVVLFAMLYTLGLALFTTIHPLF
jgi:hypothetical protein